MHARILKVSEKVFYVARCKGRVRLSSGPEIVLNSDVQLTSADFKPTASSCLQWFGFFNLF